jgi:hypothetical protein
VNVLSRIESFVYRFTTSRCVNSRILSFGMVLLEGLLALLCHDSQMCFLALGCRLHIIPVYSAIIYLLIFSFSLWVFYFLLLSLP